MVDVLFTHDAFQGQLYGGVPRYFVEVIKRLPLFTIRPRLPMALYTNKFVEHSGICGRMSARVPQVRGIRHIVRPVNRITTALSVAHRSPSIVHETDYGNSARSNGTTVFTVYDLIPEIFPQHFTHYVDAIARRSAAFLSPSHFVAISEATKRDLVERFGVPDNRIRVIHLGSSLEVPSQRPRRRLDSILYVGRRETYKNFASLVVAFQQSRFLREEVELCLFGGGGLSPAEKRMLASAGIRRHRHVTGNDEVLASAYCEATMFVCPSLYEGFGLPLLEAMEMGCPVVCSNTSSLPEVAGEAAAYFDPHSTEHMAEVISRVFGSTTEQLALVDRGRKRVTEFSWHRTAREHAEFYTALAG